VRKARSSLDVALPDLTGDAAYLEALNGCLPGVLDHFVPDLILLQGGVDAHRDDRLAARNHMVSSQARLRGIPLASTLGGGYGTDREAVALRHTRTILTLAASFG
jgi:acetoin utilization deacetylase AcuC-like enzyme